ncbi:hypothetical protein [Ureaplasma canigenitalium]|uniref:hypothetical protein n=1 Tax=Ureaplasma canigenitalium TaxID=42092 RepID=UPI0004E18F30|nr:hypothetical protein [Ureaplasma canigenitalium]
MKSVLIVNKSYQHLTKFNKDTVHDSGVFTHNDRYLKIVQTSFDDHIKKKSKPLFYFMKWWFENTNYKLNEEISTKKRSLRYILVESFFIICILGLISCILAGVAKPFIDAIIKSINLTLGKFKGDLIVNGQEIVKGLTPDDLSNGKFELQIQYVPKVWEYSFNSSSVIVPLIFTLFFFFFTFIYIYRRKKIIPKTNKMSVEDFLIARMNMINSFKGILKRKIKLIPGEKSFNHRLIFNMNIDFSLLRIMNYIYSGLTELNVVMVVNLDSDQKIIDLKQTLNQDFQNLGMIVIEEENMKNLRSPYMNGFFNQDIELLSPIKENEQSDANPKELLIVEEKED